MNMNMNMNNIMNMDMDMEMDPNERNGRNNGDSGNNTAHAAGPIIPDTPAIMFQPYEIQSQIFPHSGRPFNTPPVTFKRLIIQIGSEQQPTPTVVENTHNRGNKNKKKKRFPKILKAINDPSLTVEDWLYDLLSSDISAEQLRNLFEGQNGIITGNNVAATLTLSLGPSRSMQIQVVKDKNGIRCTKGGLDKEQDNTHANGNGKKRKRRANSGPKSLKIQLVTSESDVLLCPRDPIYQLIGSTEKVVLESDGEGSWESQEIVIPSTTTAFDGSGDDDDNVDTPAPAEIKTQQQQQRKQQLATSAKKRRKTEKEEESYRRGSEQEEAGPKTDDNRKVQSKRKSTSKIDHRSKTTDNDDVVGVGGDNNDDDKNEKSKTGSPRKTMTNTANHETKPKPENPIVGAQKKEESSPGSSDRDVLIGNGTLKNPGNVNYNKYLESKCHECVDQVNRKPIIDEIKSKFRFYKKPKGSESWALLSGSNRTVFNKITRDLNTALKNAESSPGSSDRDVLIARGTINNPGNVNYNEYLESKINECMDQVKRKRIIDRVKSNFLFFKKPKESESFALLNGSNKIVSNKIMRDVNGHLKRHQKKEGDKGTTKPQEERKVVDKKVIKVVDVKKVIKTDQTKQETARQANRKNADDSSSQESDEEANDPPKKSEGGSLSDETAEVEEKEEEEIEKNSTDEKSDEERISTNTSKDKPSRSDESDGDDTDDSSSSSSSSSGDSDSGKETENENENGSSTKLHISENNTTSIADSGGNDDDEDEENDDDDDEEEDDEEEKKNGGRKNTIRGNNIPGSLSQPATTSVVIQSQKDVSKSENNSDDDSSTNSSDDSSTSSSSVSSSSSSSSSSSASSDSSGTEKKKGSKPPRDVHIKSTPITRSNQEQHQQQSVKRTSTRKKRKPLLPQKEFVFLDNHKL
jgi:hypothetical protein